MANQLPQGFVVDQPVQSGLPQGFTLDSQPTGGLNVTDNTGRGNTNVRDIPSGEVSIGDTLLGGAEVAGTVLSSAIAEPIAGLSGLVATAFGGVDGGVDTVKLVKDALTFEPGTKEGRSQLKAVGEFIAPVAEGLSTTEKFLGDAVLNATGSPELAAIAHSLPTAALEAFGVKGLRSARLKDTKLSANVGEAIQQASPDFERIKSLKTSAYSELDKLGVKIKSETYDKFADKLASQLKGRGIDPIISPKAQQALNRILSEKGSPKSLGEMDTLRKIAKGAANDIDKTESALGTIIIKEIDAGLDSLSSEIGGKFKDARGLAQRGFKAQDMQDLIENASIQASGFENGLRIGARRLVKQITDKKVKGYTADEKAALKDLVEGDFASNTAKKLSRLGFGKGAATNHLGASSSIGAGGILGSVFGGPVGTAIGVITPPIIGRIAANTVERLTLNKTKFTDDLVRAGKNAKAVTRTYLKHTPIKNRNVDDLTTLLLHNDLDLSSIKSLPKSAEGTAKLIADAKFFAEEIKRRAQQGASAGLITTPTIPQENN